MKCVWLRGLAYMTAIVPSGANYWPGGGHDSRRRAHQQREFRIINCEGFRAALKRRFKFSRLDGTLRLRSGQARIRALPDLVAEPVANCSRALPDLALESVAKLCLVCFPNS